MGITGYYTHRDCRLHKMGDNHPECPERLDAIEDRLLITGVADALQRREPQPANLGEIKLAHRRMYIAAMRGMNDWLEEDDVAAGQQQNFSLDSDTSMNSRTYRAALLSAGAAVEAVDAVLAGEMENAFCAVRPPGHHACGDKAMGFCFFNNVAIAAKYAVARHGLERVAIIDFDVHHGNGTDDIVCGDDRILMVSFYQHPFYPEGTAREGANLLNVPVAAYTKGEAIREIVNNQWIPRLDEFKPEMIFISAGFDAHREDDMGQLGLVEADYEWITRRIKEVAMRHSQGRIVSCLEGDYNLSSLARSVEAHVRALADV